MHSRNIHYQNALDLVKNNDVSNAVKELKLCLKFNENSTAALNLLGLAYYLKCRFEKAEEKWRKSLNIRRENNKAADYLELITKRDFKELRREYKKFLFNDDADQIKKIAFLEDVIDKHEELIEPYVVLGLMHKKNEEYEKALEYFYQAYDLDSGSRNIKNYILECEEEKSGSSVFNFDNKKIVLTAAAAVFILFSGLLFFNRGTDNSLHNNTSQETTASQQAAEETKGKDQMDQAESDQIDETEASTELETGLDISGSINNSDEQQLNTEEQISNFINSQNSADDNFENTDFDIADLYLSFSQLQNILHKEEKKEELEEYSSYIDNGSTQRLFEIALLNFRQGNYNEAADMFESIYLLSDLEYLKKESLFLLSRSYENSENYRQAEYYYNRYLSSYKESNYYDEALYNLGLMYYEIGEPEKSRNVLQRLREEEPYSQYNNSKVYDIIEEE